MLKVLTMCSWDNLWQSIFTTTFKIFGIKHNYSIEHQPTTSNFQIGPFVSKIVSEKNVLGTDIRNVPQGVQNIYHSQNTFLPM